MRVSKGWQNYAEKNDEKSFDFWVDPFNLTKQ